MEIKFDGKKLTVRENNKKTRFHYEYVHTFDIGRITYGIIYVEKFKFNLIDMRKLDFRHNLALDQMKFDIQQYLNGYTLKSMFGFDDYWMIVFDENSKLRILKSNEMMETLESIRVLNKMRN